MIAQNNIGYCGEEDSRMAIDQVGSRRSSTGHYREVIFSHHTAVQHHTDLPTLWRMPPSSSLELGIEDRRRLHSFRPVQRATTATSREYHVALDSGQEQDCCYPDMLTPVNCQARRSLTSNQLNHYVPCHHSSTSVGTFTVQPPLVTAVTGLQDSPASSGSTTSTRRSAFEPYRSNTSTLPDVLEAQRNLDSNVSNNQSANPRPRNQRNSSSNQANDVTAPNTSVNASRGKACDEACCQGCLAACTSYRCALVTLATLGWCVIASGIVFGGLYVGVAREELYLILSILLISLGFVVALASFVAWRCRPLDGHEPCHSLFGLGNYRLRGQGQGRSRRENNTSWEYYYGYEGNSQPPESLQQPPPSYRVAMRLDQLRQHPGQAQAVTSAGQTSQRSSRDLIRSPPPSYVAAISGSRRPSATVEVSGQRPSATTNSARGGSTVSNGNGIQRVVASNGHAHTNNGFYSQREESRREEPGAGETWF